MSQTIAIDAEEIERIENDSGETVLRFEDPNGNVVETPVPDETERPEITAADTTQSTLDEQSSMALTDGLDDTEEGQNTAETEPIAENVDDRFAKFVDTYSWELPGERSLKLIPTVVGAGELRYVVRIYAEGVIGALSIDDCLRTEVIDLFQIPSEVVEEMVQVQRKLESEFDRVPTTKKERLIDTLLSSDTEDTE